MKVAKYFIMTIILFSFALVADMTDMITKAQDDITEKGFYTNGTHFEGTLGNDRAYYTTMTLYKGNEYAFVFGAGENTENLKVYIYEQNMLNLAAKDVVDKGSYKIVYLEPKFTAAYHVKIAAFGAEEGNGWMYLYGFKE